MLTSILHVILRRKALAELVVGFLRTGEPLTKMIYLIFNIVVSIILSKSNIGTKEDEESGVLMGFWRSLSGSRLRPAGRCQLTALQCNIFSTGGVLSRVEWSEQPVDGQVSGPQVFRKSDHLPHPPPLLNSPSAQNQQRVRKVLKLGLTTLASDPGCVVAVWVEMEKDTGCQIL